MSTQIRSARDLAAAVKGRRMDLELSQAELARRAGVARKSISELESGRSQPELALVLQVLEELGLVIELGDRQRSPKGAIDLNALIEEHRRK